MNSPLLLDTCAALWILADEISQATADALTQSYQAGLPTYVSPITAWEVAMLSQKRRFKSPYSPERWLERLLALPSVALSDLSPGILMASWSLPGKLNRDPADRIIAATAREYGLTVMTRDRALLDYAAEGHLSAVEC